MKIDETADAISDGFSADEVIEHFKTSAEEIRNFENDSGIESGFYQNLIEVDDWTFVIQLHALFETALNDLIFQAFPDKPELNTFFAKHSVEGHIGKKRLLLELKMIDPFLANFLGHLSGIRNKLVHNIKNLGYSIRDDSKEGGSFYELIKQLLKDNGSNKPENLDKALQDPKRFIWTACQLLLASILLKKRRHLYGRRLMSLSAIISNERQIRRK